MECVKVVNPNDSWCGTECYIGDNKISNVKSVDFHVGVDEVPVFMFKTHGLPVIDMKGDVKFDFTPNTISEAAEIIRRECTKENSVVYKALCASIQSAINDLPKESMECDAVLAIADRIIGLDS